MHLKPNSSQRITASTTIHNVHTWWRVQNEIPKHLHCFNRPESHEMTSKEHISIWNRCTMLLAPSTQHRSEYNVIFNELKKYWQLSTYIAAISMIIRCIIHKSRYYFRKYQECAGIGAMERVVALSIAIARKRVFLILRWGWLMFGYVFRSSVIMATVTEAVGTRDSLLGEKNG